MTLNEWKESFENLGYIRDLYFCRKCGQTISKREIGPEITECPACKSKRVVRLW